MKRFILILAVALFGIAPMVSAENRPIEVGQMPKAALEFIKGNFGDAKVLLATVDREILDTDYHVHLVDGTKIEFDGSGEWTDVSNKRTGVPASVLPLAIDSHIKSLYPDCIYLSIERDTRGYEIKLSSGLELEFSLAGKLIGIDD